ncbi:MAG: DUF1987 domain-containing protein [Bacteroidetes bacterium]|nr:MAG: DUF1987 domain-containing protein [Bacteroidota bacterium]
MQNLLIKGVSNTYFTPYVSFDANTGECLIQGESYLEESFDFYNNLMKWLNNYFSEGGQSLDLSFQLTYFNTSSSRAILEMIKLLKKHKDSGKQITINWLYPNPDDDELQMEAEDFIEESGFPMNLVEYEN